MRFCLPLILSLLLPGWLFAAGEGYLLSAIEDGDTLVMQIDGKETRIQLPGIDAPEDIDNPKLKYDVKRTGLAPAALLAIGKQATAFLMQQIRIGDHYPLSGDLLAHDRYGRIPADIPITNSATLSQQMVKAGYAIINHRASMTPQAKAKLEQLQSAAREAQRGLWGSDATLMEKWAGE